MTDEAARTLRLALKLPESDRAAIVVVLIDSIGDGSSPEEIEAVCIAEVERRREDLHSARTTAVPWEDVRRKLEAIIRRARQRQVGAD